jgi:hypothetical protein
MDYSLFAIPKKCRIKDKKAKEKVRGPRCEVCGKAAFGEPHHVETVGSGGPDAEENQIQLCQVCHILAHSGKLTKRFLFAIIARREKMDTEDLIEGVKQRCV